MLNQNYLYHLSLEQENLSPTVANKNGVRGFFSDEILFLADKVGKIKI